MARSALKRKKAKRPPAKKHSRGLVKRGIKAERASRAVNSSVLQSAKQRLDAQSLWDANASFNPHLAALGLQSDANHRGDRSRDGGTRPLQPVDASESDEMRAAVGKPRSPGTRMPKRLTANETRLCEALMERHGDDVVSMSRDMELNPHQVRSHLLLVCGTHTLLTCFQHSPDNDDDVRVIVSVPCVHRMALPSCASFLLATPPIRNSLAAAEQNETSPLRRREKPKQREELICTTASVSVSFFLPLRCLHSSRVHWQSHPHLP